MATAVERKVKGLLAQRNILIMRIKRIDEFVLTLSNNELNEAVNVRLTEARETSKQIKDLELEILSTKPDEELDTSEGETLYYNIETKLGSWLRLHAEQRTGAGMNDTINTTQGGCNKELRLPKGIVPTFDGHYQDWPTFHDLFCSNIHDRMDITASQKFQFLSGYLKGEASNLIKHLRITDANYFEALEKLRDRYNRKKQIVNSYLTTFLQQESVLSTNVGGIRKLLDTSDEILRGLKALGNDAESRDPWIIRLMLNKLDQDTRERWSEESKNEEFPSVKKFFKFLQGRIDALEDLKSLQGQNRPTRRRSPQIRAHVSATINCPCCQKEGHKITECCKFKQLSTNDRRKVIQNQQRCFNCLNVNHPVFRCMARSRCASCGRKHHTLLHPEPVASDEEIQVKTTSSGSGKSSATVASAQVSEPSVTSNYSDVRTQTILPTAIVKFTTVDHKIEGSCRILMDSGSQVSFVSETFTRRFKIPMRQRQLSVAGLGQINVGKTKTAVQLQLINDSNESILTLEAYCLPKITSNLPQVQFSLENKKYLKNIRLADPSFNVPGEIDVLIGADHFFNVLESGTIRNDCDEVVAQNTRFGWVVTGTQLMHIHSHYAMSLTSLAEIETYVRSMWETEAVPNRLHRTVEEKICESLFKDTTKRNAENRFVVRLPFKEPPSVLGNSINQALSRLYSLERRFKKEPEFEVLYQQFMHDYVKLGHMREISVQESLQPGNYIPHHGILRGPTGQQKFRVVFDASAKDSSGRSLNEILRNGPTVQSSLYSILLRFRVHKYVFTTDIQKMYRQILVAEEDRRWQRIVWRNRNDEVRHFELMTVTYGTKSAPFLATRVIQEIANENLSHYPIAAREISQNIYVDDLMTGGASLNEVTKLMEEIQRIFGRYKMQLGKWVANSEQLLDGIPESHRETALREITDETNIVKVLGLMWAPINDTFTFTVNLQDNIAHTKRTILSEACRVYDPLGLISPCIIPIKMLLQQLWMIKLEWDDELPMEIKCQWIIIRNNLVDLQELAIPRWVYDRRSEVEIHGFCDASQQAYGAVVYVRTMEGNVAKVSLLTSKSKVAPIKSLTIPKLELCAAVLLTKLLISVKESLPNTKIASITCWSDSTIVLDWLAAYPKGKDIFVKNRVAIIVEQFNCNCWRHVSSGDNPADLVSRGITPRLLSQSNLWWNGPSWLSEHRAHWPLPLIHAEPIVEIGITSHVTSTDNARLAQLVQRVSSFERIVKVIARIQQLGRNAKLPKTNRTYTLTTADLQQAELVIVKYIQGLHFSNEVANLIAMKDMPQSSRIRNLRPFMDDQGVLRVGGRISNAAVEYHVKHPIILCNKSEVVRKLVEDYHCRFRHAGPTLLHNILKQRFCIVGGRLLCRSVYQRCIKCRKANPITQQQLMADLPEHRVQLSRPFLKVGVDYAGPLMAYHRRARGQRSTKVYVCIFVCLATKAVHIEVANDLTTEEFLGAWKWMTARRGLCSDMFSDCGSNFVGANKLLIEWYRMLKNNHNIISESLLRQRVNWHFNPPSAPHFGGIWEAAVKSFKSHLKRVVGQNILTISELNTLVVEIEGILNSRPLCRGDNDVDVLTPGHFLIGHPITSLPEPRSSYDDLTYLKRWQLVKQMVHHFWVRWHQEYLVTLQHRYKWQTKWPNAAVDDIVVIKDENLAATRWALGRITEVHRGRDELVRSVTLKTQSGTIRRPIHKLVILPMGESTDSRGPGC